MQDFHVEMKSFIFIFIFSKSWESITDLLPETGELIGILGALAAIGGIITLIFQFLRGKPFKSFVNILKNICRIFNKNPEPRLYSAEYVVKREKLIEALEKAFKNENTKVIVITGDVEMEKTVLVDVFLNKIQGKTIDFSRYHVIRCNLRTIVSQEELLRRISYWLKEFGSEKLYEYIKEFGSIGAEEVLIWEFNSEKYILFLDNFDPGIHDEIIDLIISTMKFYGKTKVILVSPTFPKALKKYKLHKMVAQVPVRSYSVEEIGDFLSKARITHSDEDADKFREVSRGNPGLITYVVTILKEGYKQKELSDDIDISKDEEFKDKKREIIYERYEKVYKSLKKETIYHSNITHMLSALRPCTFEDIFGLYRLFFGTEMSDNQLKSRLYYCLEDILRYNLIYEKDGKYSMDDLLKELIYTDFGSKEEFHKTAQKYFEEKVLESPGYKDDYEFHVIKHKEATEIECPHCGKTVLKKDGACKYCGSIFADATRIY